jgi:DNA-binding CsgD family transcriptional regulator
MISERDRMAFGSGQRYGELTQREQDVAALISEGLTNEEIAQRLTLTTGTVANHVAHILVKTGARSRVQVAVKLVRTPPARIPDDVLQLLMGLQVLDPIDARGALQQATELLASFFDADASDAFVYDPAREVLVALASSNTRLAGRQRELQLDRLPLSHSGRIGWVFQEQQPFRDGCVQDDAFELAAVRRDLGIRSTLAAPFEVSAECRGVLVVRSVVPENFVEADLELIRFVAYWVALVAQQHSATGQDRAAAM